MSERIIAKSEPPQGETKAKVIAQFIALGWWDCMMIAEREAFFERGELLDSPFARQVLLPVIKRSVSRSN